MTEKYIKDGGDEYPVWVIKGSVREARNRVKMYERLIEQQERLLEKETARSAREDYHELVSFLYDEIFYWERHIVDSTKVLRDNGESE
jgi:hypothetical protein